MHTMIPNPGLIHVIEDCYPNPNLLLMYQECLQAKIRIMNIMDFKCGYFIIPYSNIINRYVIASIKE